ncbi:MAG: hypothetical protein PVS3B3_04810 [Ktedonobacteraceae bacterium]
MVYIVLFIFALAGSALVVLTIENLTTQVQFAVFAWQSPNLPLGLVVLIAFILGALLLYIVSALSALRDGSEKRRLRRRVNELEQQLATVTIPQPVLHMPPPAVPMPGVPPQH